MFSSGKEQKKMQRGREQLTKKNSKTSSTKEERVIIRMENK